MIERIGTGVRSSKIVKSNGVVYLSGQVGNPEDDITEQTKEVLRRIDALLAEAGSSNKHILQAIVWLADMSDFAALNDVWNAWVPEGYAPARACGEAKLARAALKVEITITAAYE